MNRRSLRMQFVAAALFAACTLPWIGAAVASADPQRGYIGVDVVERGEGLMVWRVMPGPPDTTNPPSSGPGITRHTISPSPRSTTSTPM